MSYWIIQSIPGQGLFFTSDTRTVADFQDNMGDVYCDGATKLFSFSANNKKGAICIAGTSIKRTLDNKFCSIQRVIANIVNSNYFAQFLNSPYCTDAKSIFKYICDYIGKTTPKPNFINDQNQTYTLETLIKNECAVGIGLINNQDITVYADGFMDNTGASSRILHTNESIIIGSNKYYGKMPISAPIITNQIFNYHHQVIHDFKLANQDMVEMISDNYDQLYCPINANNDLRLLPKVGNILDKNNYSSLGLEALRFLL